MEPVRDADLDLLVAAAEKAGDVALSYFRKSPKSWTKGKGSPVSEADVEVDRLLADRLLSARPAYAWLSEETADSEARLSARRIFVVDPIDGTRNYLEGGKEWAISLAVVEGDRPVSAVLFAPALGEMFQAVAGGGARRNGALIGITGRSHLEGARLSGPKRFTSLVGTQIFAKAPTLRSVPSLAYRFALVAAGELDAAVAGPNAHDWDLAAADLLVHEAGGQVADLSGLPVRYNRAIPRHPSLIAAPGTLQGPIATLLENAGQSG
jgi:myo-inositol-1(or 4)-monophosphatase